MGNSLAIGQKIIMTAYATTYDVAVVNLVYWQPDTGVMTGFTAVCRGDMVDGFASGVYPIMTANTGLIAHI